MKRIAVSAAVLLAAFLSFACRTTSHTSEPACPPTWSYDQQGEWPGWCQDTTGQSPIFLRPTSEAHMQPLEVKWTPMPLIMVNTGHDIEMHGNKSVVTFEGEDYQLEQFHMHVPPEHQDGQAHAAEIHFLHKKASDPTKLFVVAVFVDTTGTNRTLEQIAGFLPLKQCPPALNTGETIDARGLLPYERDQWVTYIGSKTTPDCDPNVRFVVLQNAMKADPGQVARFREQFPKGNARDLQRPTGPMPIVKQIP